MNHPPPETFVITLRPISGPQWPPAIVRLRRLLKAALRCYGLRCTDAKREK
jgi:hypothetical protein